MGVEGYQGFAGNMANTYSKIGNSGMSKQDIKQQGELATAEYQQQATLEKQPERQQFCRMYGVDAQQFDYNGDGLIGKKEFADIQKFVQRYGANGLYGQQGFLGSSGFGNNAFALLNSPEAKNILSTVGDATGLSNTGFGNTVSEVWNAFKGIFS